jgi:hypothetical protein
VEKGEAQKEVKVIVSPEDSPPSVLKKIKDLQERLKNSSDQFVPFP